jgi:site-specific recombinase XerD
MKSTFRILFYLKRDKQKADGTVPVWCRITVDGLASRFNTKSNILPDLWDAKAAKAAGKSKAATEINSLLDAIKAGIYKIYYDLQTRENSITAERIKNIFLGIEVKNQTLLELFKRHNEDVAKLVGISKSKATYQKYEVTRKHLANLIRERYNASDIALKEINQMFISDFEVYLLTSAGCNANTTAKFMQFFKRIVLIARNNGWIHADPFVNYKIRIAKVDRGYLTQGEIETIMQKKLVSKRLEQVRDIFIFSCFTGLAYIDVKNLREKHIRTSFDGNLWIMTKRQKTDVNSNIPLLDVPKQILDKYSGTLPNEAVLPVLSNQKMNSYLKEIGDVCGINKNLTFHLARHTFATTTTLAKGVPIETVSKMLGHTNIKTTQIYARVTDNKIGNDMAILAGQLQGMASRLTVN